MSLLKYALPAVALCLTLIILPARTSWGAESDTLIFLHYWTGPLSGGINEMAENFNRTSPGVNVRATGFEHESFKVGINVMLAGGSPPDMFSYWAGAKIQAMVDQNYLAPIDDAWNEAELDQIFPPAVAQACTYYTHKYALPLTQHYVTFFYNTKIFEKHGITSPESWEDFIAVCDKLKRAGVTPVALGSREKWPAQFWFDYLMLRTAGPDYRQELMDGSASYGDPEVEKVFAIWKSLLDAGYFNDSPNQLDWSEASKLVQSGEAAMTLMGTWIIGLFDGQLGLVQGEDYDFFRFPAMSPSIAMTALGPIDAIVIPREGNPNEAKKALAFFSDPGPQMEMSRGSGALSPSRAIPSSFYTPLQGRILKTIRKTPHWAFNYDLATPPEMAELGLNAFKEFIQNPARYRKILADIDQKSGQFFKSRNQ